MKPDLTLSELSHKDLARTQDFVGGIETDMDSNNTPSVKELWDRRMVVRTLRREIRDLLAGSVSMDVEADWVNLERRVNSVLFENFTRQLENTDTIEIISDSGVKHERYATADGEERRTYLGMHRRKLDNDGLSVVVAFKPTFHEQPFHIHNETEENTLAIHSTVGLSCDNRNEQVNFHFMNPGEIVNFGNGVPHTLKNLSRKISADASVKMPEAINDRRRLDRTDIWKQTGQFDGPKESGLREPEYKQRDSRHKHVRYLIEDCGRKYKVDFLQLFPNATIELDVDAIAKDTIGLMTVFPTQGRPNAEISIAGQGDPVIVSFSDWAALNPQHAGILQLRNHLDEQALVYMVREV